MLRESTEALDIKPDGIYVDVTYGGGGHSREILKHLKNGKLFAFDQDPDALANKAEDDRLILINQNFRFLQNFLRMYQVIPVDGLLADLGISSHQIDTDDRGFAFRSDGPLDMRMDRSGKLTAEMVVNDYTEEELVQVFSLYGEIRNARQLARKISESRSENRIKTSGALVDIASKLVPGRMRNKYLAQVFQAIRIEVNGEMDALKDLLNQCAEIISEDGRIAFITYHSLEDRLVKNFIRSGNFEGNIEKDFYGNVLKPFEAVNRKPLLPSAEELERNNRSRSAKLRIAKRLKSE